MFLLRIAAVLTLCLACVGCEPSAPSIPNDSVGVGKERPPLRVWIVDAPEIERELLIRWQASSDQSLAIENVLSKDLLARKTFAFDTIIFPGNILGDLVEREIISKLPTQVTMRGATTRGATEAVKSLSTSKAEDESPEEDLSKTWPSRFPSISSYAGKLYAVPLGSNALAFVSKGVDVAPLMELQNNLAAPQGTSAKSLELWQAFLSPVESSSDAGKAENELFAKLADVTEQEKERLVDQFLWISSTTDKQKRGLFDLSKMNSRLTAPEFVNAARILSQLARLFPESFIAPRENAWALIESSPNDAKSIAIDWPGTVPLENESNRENKSGSDDVNDVQVVPIFWNPNRGLIASIGKGTRQTSVSIQFLSWMSLPEQREALRGVCSRVELLADQPDRNLIRDDYRKYTVALNRANQQVGMQWSLRLINAQQYRDSLVDALIQVIRTPVQAESIMAECSKKWDELTESLGKEKQRNSEERSQGFNK